MIQTPRPRCEHLDSEERGFQCVDCGAFGCGFCVSLTTIGSDTSLSQVAIGGSQLDFRFRCKPCAAKASQSGD